MRRPNARYLMFLLLLSLSTTGCEDGYGPPPFDPGGQGPATVGVPTRIVSLTPELTRMIVDMGHAGKLVGVSDTDTFESDDVLRVGSLQEINTTRLIEAKPTRVVYFDQGGPAADRLASLAASNDFKIVGYPAPGNSDDVMRIIFEPDALSITDMGEVLAPTGNSLTVLLDDRGEGVKLSRKMSTQLVAVSNVVQAVPVARRPYVLIVTAVGDKWKTVGPKTVLHELLSTYVGGFNAAVPRHIIPDPSERTTKIVELKPLLTVDQVGPAPVMDAKRIDESRPDVILLLIAGTEPLTSIEEDDRLAILRGLNKVPAVKNKRVVLLNDDWINLPASSAMAQITARMARAIYPQLAEQIDLEMKKFPSADEVNKANADDASTSKTPAKTGSSTSDGNLKTTK